VTNGVDSLDVDVVCPWTRSGVDDHASDGVACGVSASQTALVVVGLAEEDGVVTVGALSALSGVVVGVGVGTSPLEVDVGVNLGVETDGEEVVLSAGVVLDNVTTLATDLQVVDGASDTSCADTEGVSSVLEGTAVLGSVDGELELELLVAIGLEGATGATFATIDQSLEEIDLGVVLENVLAGRALGGVVVVGAGVEGGVVVGVGEAVLGPDINVGGEAVVAGLCVVEGGVDEVALGGVVI